VQQATLSRSTRRGDDPAPGAGTHHAGALCYHAWLNAYEELARPPPGTVACSPQPRPGQCCAPVRLASRRLLTGKNVLAVLVQALRQHINPPPPGLRQHGGIRGGVQLLARPVAHAAPALCCHSRARLPGGLVGRNVAATLRQPTGLQLAAIQDGSQLGGSGCCWGLQAAAAGVAVARWLPAAALMHAHQAFRGRHVTGNTSED